MVLKFERNTKGKIFFNLRQSNRTLENTKKAAQRRLSLLVSSVGLASPLPRRSAPPHRHTPVCLSSLSNPLLAGSHPHGSLPTKKAARRRLSLLVSSVGLASPLPRRSAPPHRHTPVCLSSLSNPLLAGSHPHGSLPTKKAARRRLSLLVSSVGFEPATL